MMLIDERLLLICGYLTDTEGDEVLLPNRYVPQEYRVGDSLDVFVYHDSEDRPVATTQRPMAADGELAAMTVVGTSSFGAFVDWGLPKDLFVPVQNQLAPMRQGGRYVVAVYVDSVTGRPVGTAKLNKFVQNAAITVQPRQAVELIVAQRQERGYRVVVERRHWGMLYDDQLLTQVQIGDTLGGYVRKITEDGRIDVALQQEGFGQVQVAAGVVLGLLEEHDGRLPVGDKSDPAEIELLTGLSKKGFKRAVGYLMRKGLVESGEDHIRRTSQGVKGGKS